MAGSRLRTAACVCAAVWLLGCNTIRAGSDFDSQVDFAQYRTWAFAKEVREPTGQPRPGQPASPLENQRIQRAIREYLEARNIPEAPRAEADVIVTYHLQFEEGIRISTGHTVSPYGYYYSYPRARRQTKGTLVIDLVDPRKRQVVWHGYAYKTIYEEAKNPDDEIRRAVALILDRYPN